MTMFPHAYYSEFVQAIAALLGFILSIWAVWDARKDEVYWAKVLQEEVKMGRASVPTIARCEIAKVHTASELATLVVHVTFMCAGITGIFLAPPDRYTRIYDTELLGVQ